MDLINFNATNNACSSSLQWTHSAMENRRTTFYICIVASIINVIFWIQLTIYSSIRQVSMQWIYAYLIIDILLLARFYFVYIVRTVSTDCIPDRSWSLFICYVDAIVDNYLNILQVYILFALNVCRYVQIVYNRNVYVQHSRLLIMAHLCIYLLPIMIFLVQFALNWAHLVDMAHDSCDVRFNSILIQLFNVTIAFALPITLNILVIVASFRYVYLTARLRTRQSQGSARDKYYHSLVLQFVAFYVVWLALWSPNIIVYQVTSGLSHLVINMRLLNYIEIALDPFIIVALDVRFGKIWTNSCLTLKNVCLTHCRRQRVQVVPDTTVRAMQTIETEKV
jgi:hypothetical protein